MPRKAKETEAKDEKVEEVKAEKSEKKDDKKSKKLSQKEFEAKVLELAEKGMTSEKIGEALRKQGIHSKEYDKSISKILKDAGKYVSPDLKNVEKKLDGLQKHVTTNKQDKRARREKDRVFAQLRKIKKYLGISVR